MDGRFQGIGGSVRRRDRDTMVDISLAKKVVEGRRKVGRVDQMDRVGDSDAKLGLSMEGRNNVHGGVSILVVGRCSIEAFHRRYCREDRMKAV